MFFSDVLRYPLTDTFNNLRYSYYKKDFTMSKYYVVSGNFKTTIIAKDPKIAAIKAIDSIGDNVDDKDKIFLGLSVVVNETGFNFINHKDSLVYDSDEILKKLGKTEEFYVPGGLIDEEFMETRCAKSLILMADAEQRLFETMDVLGENFLADEILLLVQQIHEFSEKIAQESMNDKYLLEPADNIDDS